MYKQLNIIFISFLLFSCGGGGEGSDPSKSVSYFVTAATNKVELTTTRSQGNFCSLEPQSVNIDFKGEGLILGYPPEAEEPNWLYDLTLSNVTSNSAQLDFTPHFACAIEPGSHSTTLRLLSGKADGSVIVHDDIVISLNVADNLQRINANELAIGVDARSEHYSGTVTFEVDTYALDWQIVSDAQWLVFSPSQASGNNSSDSQLVQISVDLNKVPSQDAIGSFTLQATDGSLATTHNINVSVDDKRAWLAKPTLAFSLFDGDLQKSKSLNLYSNFNADLSTISITPVDSWLTAELIDDQISFSVTRDSLSSGFYRTSVSLSQHGISLGDDLEVGLYIHDGSKPDSVEFYIADYGYEPRVVVDPVGPYVYSIVNSKVKIFNIYTGEVINELSFPLNEELYYKGDGYEYPHYVSEDGKSLFISNATGPQCCSGGEEYIYHRFDLIAQQWLTDVPASEHNKTFSIEGHKYSFTYSGALLKEDGTEIIKDNEECYFNDSLSQGASLQGRKYYHIDTEDRYGIERLKPIMFNKVGIMACESLDVLTPAEIDTRFDQYKMSTSYDGQSLVLNDRFFTYDSQLGFSTGIDLAIPDAIANNSSIFSLELESVLIDDKGHSFVYRSAFTGSSNSPNYITEYDTQGNVVTTDEVSINWVGMMFSADGAMLISNEYYDWMAREPAKITARLID